MVTKRKRATDEKKAAVEDGASSDAGHEATDTSTMKRIKIVGPQQGVKQNGHNQTGEGTPTSSSHNVNSEVQLAGQKIIAILKTIDGSKRLLSGGTIFDKMAREAQTRAREQDRLSRRQYIDFVLEKSSASFTSLSKGFEEWFSNRETGLDRISYQGLDIKRKQYLLRHCAKLRQVCSALVKKAIEESETGPKFRTEPAAIPTDSAKELVDGVRYGLYQSTPNGFIFSNLAKGLHEGDMENLDLARSNVIAIEAMPKLLHDEGVGSSKPLTFRETSRRVKERSSIDLQKLQSRSEKVIPRARFLSHDAFQSFAPTFDSSFGYLTREEMSMVWEYRVQAKYLHHLKNGAIRALRSRVRGRQGKLEPLQDDRAGQSGVIASAPKTEETDLDQNLFEKEGLDINAILSTVPESDALDDALSLVSVSDAHRSLQANAEALLYLQGLQRKRLITDPTSQVQEGSEEWHLARRLQSTFTDLLKHSGRSERALPNDRSRSALADNYGLARGNLGHFILDRGYAGVLPPLPPPASNTALDSSGRYTAQQRYPSTLQTQRPYQQPIPGSYRGPGRPRIYPPGSTPSSRAAANRVASHSGSPTPTPLPPPPQSSQLSSALPPIPKYSQQAPASGMTGHSTMNTKSPSHFTVPTIPRNYAAQFARR